MTQSSPSSLYHRHRFPSDMIAHAVWLYFKFQFSLRMFKTIPPLHWLTFAKNSLNIKRLLLAP